jgi:hypothetical protein
MPTSKFLLLILSVVALSLQLAAQTKTTLLSNGSAATKFDIVFMGDGFTSSQQTEYNNLVDSYFRGMFTYNNGALDNVFAELQDALNVYRVNANSTQSGVTQYTCSTSGCPSRSGSKNTAYNFKYSGCWDCCWMAKSSDTDTKINNALTAVGLAGAEFVVMILNESGGGGCSYGSVLSVTKTMSNNVLMHEMGHSIGGLCDEYDRPGCFSGTNPTCRNVSVNSNNNKWNLFARNPISTGNPIEYNVSQGGAFEGARYSDDCIYRPTDNSAMRGNTNLFNPPSYDEFWVKNKPRSNYSFKRVLTGNFKGSDFADVLLHFDKYIAAYETGEPDGFTSTGTAIRLKSSYTTTKIFRGPGGNWSISADDEFRACDFTGDGKDDLIIFRPNGASSRLALIKSTPDSFQTTKIYYYDISGWQMRNNDRIRVGDFSGDGKEDIVIFNADDWSVGYLAMFKSTGSALNYVKRYDGYLPGHYMSEKDRLFISDFNGDNKDDLIVFNTLTQVTRLFKSETNSYTIVAEYFGALPGWTSKTNDRYHVADFNGDGKDDLYITNTVDWGPEYVLMLRSNGSGFDFVRRYDDIIPGWNMQNGDEFKVADLNGDGKDDLVIYNHSDWSTEYLARAITDGSTLSASFQGDWIGGWNLGSMDKIVIADRPSGKDELFIHNDNWFGYMAYNSSGFYLRSMYKDYIHAFKHHDYGWY